MAGRYDEQLDGNARSYSIESVKVEVLLKEESVSCTKSVGMS